jgi:GNAT superfamily N-acetyltransferase
MDTSLGDGGGARTRHATEQDVDAIAALAIELHEFTALGVRDRLRLQEAYDLTSLGSRIAQIMKSPDAAMLVVEADGRVVGVAEVYLRQDPVDALSVSFRYGDIQTLVIVPERRRHGFGLRLLRTAEAWARGRGAVEMRLSVWGVRRWAVGPLWTGWIQDVEERISAPSATPPFKLTHYTLSNARPQRWALSWIRRGVFAPTPICCHAPSALNPS